ncbi:MAG TPA: nucleotide exchange factor GrpE [Clostridiales bacterium]|nr:nucleotide exchange factor GrpE [Clostridiales bacterium]
MAKKDKADISKDSKDKTTAEESIKDLFNENCECNDCKCNENVEEDCEETKLKEEYDAINNKMLRLQADFLNYKTRTEKEKSTTYGNAVSDVLTDLLPIIDNFERAIDAVNSEIQEVINFKNGVKMIYDQFLNTLQKKGLKEIEALNSKFDPNMHSGIAFEVTEEKEEDTVIEVFQKGYVVNDKVIRPSMVKIARK